MKKILAASIAAIGIMGLAACSDTDDTTTQSVDPAQDSSTAPTAAPTGDATGGADTGGMGTTGTDTGGTAQ